MSLPLAAWLVVTAVHVWLTVRAARRIADREKAPVDVIAGLAASVHVAAITAGLSVLSGAVCLALWHAGLAWFWRAQGDPASGLGLPPLEVRWLMVATVVTALHAAAGARKEGRARQTVAAVVAVSVIALTASALTARNASAQAGARLQAGDEESSYRSSVPPANVWRRAYWAVIAAESSRQLPCSARRFYSLVRFDEPLALQAPWYGTEVYYAGRDVEAVRRAGPLRQCDYAITTVAVADTQKGQRLIDALFAGQPIETVGTTPEFLLIALRRR